MAYHAFIAQAIALNPSRTHVFASGADSRVRAWDVQSGQPVVPGDSNDSLLGKTFEQPVTGLDISEEGVVQVLIGREIEVFRRGRVML